MKNLCLLLSAFCLVPSLASAGRDKDMNSSRQQDRHSEESDAPAWRGVGYIVAAIPMDCDIVNPSTVQFNQPADTSTDNAKLGKLSSGVGLGVYRDFFCEWLQAGVTYEFYAPFYYAKHQADATAATGLTDSPAVSAETLGANYERSFTLNNQSAMFNLEFSLPRNWSWETCNMSISPMLGAGVGLGVNTVSNFQAVGWSSNVTSGTPAGVLQLTTVSRPKTHVGVAWQVNAGFNFRPVDSDLSFALAYRYYNGGKFSTQSSFMLNDNVLADQGNEIALTAWTCKLRTNQVVMCLDFQF